MKKIFYSILFSLSMISCSDHPEYLSEDNPLGAGRNFIESCSKGDFEKASFYMIQDTDNIALLKKVNTQYQLLNSAKRKQLSESSIVILDVSYVTQSETIINYKYSYDGYARKVKVIAQPKGNWLVDFKYSNNGNL